MPNRSSELDRVGKKRGARRVLFVASSARLAGGNRFLTTTAVEMQRRSIEVDYLFLSNGPAVARAQALGLAASHLPLSAPDAGTPLRSLIDTGRAIANLGRKGPDLVHANDLAAARAFAIACRCAGVPLICHLHTPDELTRPYLEWVFRRLPAPSAFIEVCSHHFQTRHELLSELYPRSRHALLPNGVDLSEFPAPHTDSSNGGRIGAIANLLPHKRVEDLLQMTRRLRDGGHDVDLHLIGDDSLDPAYTARLHSLTDELGLERLAHFLGRREDVPTLLASFDIFVHASAAEAHPVAILEAQAAGLPVVATTVGGTSEIVEEGVSGYLVPPRQPEQLAERVERLLRDRSLARRMGESGRHRVELRSDVRHVVDSLLRIYQGEPTELPDAGP